MNPRRKQDREALARRAFTLASEVKLLEGAAAALSDDYTCPGCTCTRRSDPAAFAASTSLRRAFKALIRAQQLLDHGAAEDDDSEE